MAEVYASKGSGLGDVTQSFHEPCGYPKHAGWSIEAASEYPWSISDWTGGYTDSEMIKTKIGCYVCTRFEGVETGDELNVQFAVGAGVQVQGPVMPHTATADGDVTVVYQINSVAAGRQPWVQLRQTLTPFDPGSASGSNSGSGSSSASGSASGSGSGEAAVCSDLGRWLSDPVFMWEDPVNLTYDANGRWKGTSVGTNWVGSLTAQGSSLLEPQHRVRILSGTDGSAVTVRLYQFDSGGTVEDPAYFQEVVLNNQDWTEFKVSDSLVNGFSRMEFLSASGTFVNFSKIIKSTCTATVPWYQAEELTFPIDTIKQRPTTLAQNKEFKRTVTLADGETAYFGFSTPGDPVLGLAVFDTTTMLRMYDDNTEYDDGWTEMLSWTNTTGASKTITAFFTVHPAPEPLMTRNYKLWFSKTGVPSDVPIWSDITPVEYWDASHPAGAGASPRLASWTGSYYDAFKTYEFLPMLQLDETAVDVEYGDTLRFTIDTDGTTDINFRPQQWTDAHDNLEGHGDSYQTESNPGGVNTFECVVTTDNDFAEMRIQTDGGSYFHITKIELLKGESDGSNSGSNSGSGSDSGSASGGDSDSGAGSGSASGGGDTGPSAEHDNYEEGGGFDLTLDSGNTTVSYTIDMANYTVDAGEIGTLVEAGGTEPKSVWFNMWANSTSPMIEYDINMIEGDAVVEFYYEIGGTVDGLDASSGQTNSFWTGFTASQMPQQLELSDDESSFYVRVAPRAPGACKFTFTATLIEE